MELKDIQKLTDVARIYNVSVKTLNDRLSKLEEGIDYKKLGHRQPTIITPNGVKKILNINEVKL